MNPLKKHLLIAAAVLGSSLMAFSSASAQTATFIYNDGGAGGGLPNSGTYFPGQSFTFSITLAFTSGGTITNLDGLSYWFQQRTPSGAPFPFSITNRDVTGSDFTDLQTPSITYPQNLNPSNANDLGALRTTGQPADPSGSYLIANLTIQIAPTATNGIYTISDTTSGGKTSVITDSLGHTFAIPEADYTITVVPEPATWAAATLTLLALLLSQQKRFARLYRVAVRRTR